MLDFLGDAWGLALAIIGFGAIIFIHELGHFLAARWAGIRVYAFAVGFGPAAIAWRKGIGVRRGSTNQETLRELRRRFEGEGRELTDLERVEEDWPAEIGKTEYRLNWLPFGGYVQMRGQDDVTPGAASGDTVATDSFSAKPVWKRMIVISAGVIMNVILAALLYVAVYTIGKPAAPPVVGGVQEGSPAADASPLNADEAGVDVQGLKPGDRIVSIQGAEPREFSDVWLAGALADPEAGVSLTVSRPGVESPLRFQMPTARPAGAEFPSIGVLPAVSTRLADPAIGDEATEANIAHLRQRAGVPDSALRIVSIAGSAVDVLPDLEPIFARSGEASVPATFATGSGRIQGAILGEAELQRTEVRLGDRAVEVRHLVGFVPPMRIGLTYRALEFGLRPGDVVARLGRVEWPGPAEGIRAIRDAAGEEIEVVVVRNGERITTRAEVGADGTIGFLPAQSLGEGGLGAIVARPLPEDADAGRAGRESDLPPGSVIETVDGAEVTDYAALRAALSTKAAGTPIELGVRLPMDARATTTMTLTEADLEALRGLGFRAPEFFQALFEPEQITIVASNPIEAVVMGVADTHQIILRTYLTLVRLFQGTVEVEQLRGPVGIAHIGTQVAQRSFVELLFFFAVISANLAVLNFLPIPIADGGMMVFLMIEWITGKPVPPAVQNAAALLGLILLGGVFLLVTFYDVTRLL